jgi:hypothetical protein
MKINPNLGMIFIEEKTSPDDNVVKNFDVYDKNGIFYAEFDSALHSFEVMNRNSRMYIADNINECLKAERIQSFLAHGGWFGEMNHPTPEYKDRPLHPDRIQDIKMDNTSHKMLNPHVEGNLLVSKIQTDAGTEAGMNMAKKMIQGFIPEFSCRAIAHMILQGGKPVVNCRKLITYDWVLYPSHREAGQLDPKSTKFVAKNPATLAMESVHDTNYDVTRVVPLTEILEAVGKTDPNAQTIMESFNLTPADMVGFSEGNKHVLIKDSDNMIYCNINPKTRGLVNDFFRSF